MDIYGGIPVLLLKYAVKVELLLYALEPFPLRAVNVTVTLDPAQTGFSETPVTVSDCACTPTVKKERRKKETIAIKILRKRKLFKATPSALIFLEV